MPVVALRFHARRVTPCGGEGSCIHFAQLTGADETWRLSLAFTPRPVPLTDMSNSVVDLAPGDYSVTMERYIDPSAIVNDQPPAETLDVTCSAAFTVEAGQGPVDVRVTFLEDRCEVAVEEHDPPVVLVSATVVEWCMSIGGCSYRATLENDEDSWYSVLDPVGNEEYLSTEGMPSALEPGAYTLTLSVHAVSDAVVNGQQSATLVGDCEVDFVIGANAGPFAYRATFQRDRCTIDQT